MILKLETMATTNFCSIRYFWSKQLPPTQYDQPDTINRTYPFGSKYIFCWGARRPRMPIVRLQKFHLSLAQLTYRFPLEIKRLELSPVKLRNETVYDKPCMNRSVAWQNGGLLKNFGNTAIFRKGPRTGNKTQLDKANSIVFRSWIAEKVVFVATGRLFGPEISWHSQLTHLN